MGLERRLFKISPLHFAFRIRKSLGIFRRINPSTPAWNAFLEGAPLPPPPPRTSAAVLSSIRFLDSQLSTPTNYISTLRLGRFGITTFAFSLTRAFLKENIFFICKVGKRNSRTFFLLVLERYEPSKNCFDVLFMLYKKRNQNVDRVFVFWKILEDFSHRTQSCFIVWCLGQDEIVWNQISITL